MALLQISEPGQSPDPHQRRIAVGIDLGTTHSLVAAVRNGIAECLPDGQGRTILPSVVRYLEGGGRQIGHDAHAAQADDPENTVASVKRFMGRGLADIANREKLPYHFIEADEGAAQAGGMVSLRTRAGVKSPVEISAEILATLRYRAEDTFSDDLYGAVITGACVFRRRAAASHQGRGQARRHQRAAADQRADRGGHRVRPGQRQPGHLRRLRPWRRHIRHLDPATEPRACSRSSPPAAIRPSAATTTIVRWPTGCRAGPTWWRQRPAPRRPSRWRHAAPRRGCRLPTKWWPAVSWRAGRSRSR